MVEFCSSRVRDTESFEEDLVDLCYFDFVEERWFLLLTDAVSGGLLSPQDSEKARDYIRVGMSRMKAQLTWDRELLTYIPRVQNSHLDMTGGIGGHIPVSRLPSQSLSPTEPSGSPRRQPASRFSAVTAVGISPIVFGGASSAPPIEGPVASPSASAQGEFGRDTKRKSGGECGDAKRRNKKLKKASAIQCSRQTLKGIRCKSKKEREDDEDGWDCDKHKKN